MKFEAAKLESLTHNTKTVTEIPTGRQQGLFRNVEMRTQRYNQQGLPGPISKQGQPKTTVS
jgi:hypothetical protein